MTLSPGARLGPYEVLSPLGAGGMGEVFKARDTRLGRSVAIKVLPAEFAGNAQLRARFEREAKTISQLNHPHICALYDVGENYLVMELLEGETVADRIARGPMPVDQVLRYGIQIAEALDRAHKAGIVHRDLKPGNVMITKSGAKLLDFGLAKEATASPINALTNLRTERKPLTEEGTLLGTFQYMAPEQLEGAAVDARTDIFALGALLYEMVTGQHAFEGKSKASLIAAILTIDPQPIASTQPASPPALDELIRACLAKDPDARWQNAYDVGLELRAIGRGVAAPAPPSLRRPVLPWIVAAVTVIAAALLAAMVWQRRTNDDAKAIRSSILPPENMTFSVSGIYGAPPALSHDARKLVVGVRDAAQNRSLWLRSLDTLEFHRLANTDGATFPFWSSDDHYIAFFADGKLKKIDLTGSPAIDICDVVDGRGGDWNRENLIIFGQRGGPIARVAAVGGQPQPVTTFTAERTHRWPQFLPDGRHFLFLRSPIGAADERNEIVVASLNDKATKRVLLSTTNAQFVSDHLIFVRDGVLSAVGFDLKTLATQGDAIALSDRQVRIDPNFGRAIFTVARDGTVLYQPGEPEARSELVWFGRDGKRIAALGGPEYYLRTSISPDQRTIAASIRRGARPNLWLFDQKRSVWSPLTTGDLGDTSPVWSPDGSKIVFSRGLPLNLFIHDLATGSDRLLLASDDSKNPTSWSPDGKTIAFSRQGNAISRVDVDLVTIDGVDKPFIATHAIEAWGQFSPDGKWLAFASNESGRFEVYICSIGFSPRKWQVSSDGGTFPHWRADGRELFYLSLSNEISAIDVSFRDIPEIGVPLKLFGTRPADVGATTGDFNVSADGQRFLVNSKTGDEKPPSPFVLVQRIDADLKRIAQEQHP